MKKPLQITKTFLPAIEEFTAYIQCSFDNNWLTNRGELVQGLEKKLINHLGIKNITLTTNGTLPLQIAIKALELKGEIITTPFSHVATTSAIVWEQCKPVYVDIDPDFLTIDAKKIEAAITDKTSAILTTHVFGNPCDIEAIQTIADKYNLRVIYDAAHCFGVNYKGKSIFNYGDVSICSFHATKIFHTGEGGCMITNDKELHEKLYYHHNFGHNGPTSFHGLGTNAKMSELQAAMGHANLDHFDKILKHRKNAVQAYIYQLEETPVSFLKIRPETNWNYHYFPILFNNEKQLLKTIETLNEHSIYPRRYFYPSLNKLPYVTYKKMKYSESISKRILCLPLSAEISNEEISTITDTIKKNF